MKYKYLFGPVPSRRLGVSLGVDLIPYKACTFDCSYCECGRTTIHTDKQGFYTDIDEVISELKDFLSGNPELGHITLSGCGEPTLHSGIGRLIGFLKDSYPSYRIALLTNGSLLHYREIRDRITRADVILPSLDAVSPGAFKKINRPCCGITPDDIISGIKLLKSESDAGIWLELLIVPGINDTDTELRLLKEAITQIDPHKIHLNTLDRPPADIAVFPASSQKLTSIKEYLLPLEAEIVKGASEEEVFKDHSNDMGHRVLSILKRRPCTVNDLVKVSDMPRNVLVDCLHDLEKSDRIISGSGKRGTFYKIKENGTKKERKKDQS